MRLTAIASGSSGNCIYVGSDTTHLLVDVGISGKKVVEGVNGLNLDMTDIDGILITHEHSDHIGGLGVIARKYGIPIYATPGTKSEILNPRYRLGDIDPDLICEIYPDDNLTIKDIKINPMRISHDAKDPVAYRFKCENRKAAVVTDLGTYNDYIVESLKGMNALFLEANHDVKMLQVGPYPYYLKQRILGDRGHLSNETAGNLLSEIINDDLCGVFLGHLSKENNLPELAYESVRVEVTMKEKEKELVHGNRGISINDIPLKVAKRSELSYVLEF